MNAYLAQKSSPKARYSMGSTPRVDNQRNFFPAGYIPGNYDVLIGRKKRLQEHVGNHRLRYIVSTKLDLYSAANRSEKSKILSSVVKEIRCSTPGGAFIKQDSLGLWFDVGDILAREKVSQTFRDALHDTYKSSNEYRKKRRQEEQGVITNPAFVSSENLSVSNSNVCSSHEDDFYLPLFKTDLPATEANHSDSFDPMPFPPCMNRSNAVKHNDVRTSRCPPLAKASECDEYYSIESIPTTRFRNDDSEAIFAEDENFIPFLEKLSENPESLYDFTNLPPKADLEVHELFSHPSPFMNSIRTRTAKSVVSRLPGPCAARSA